MAKNGLKPLLRWAGSKQRLIPALIERMPMRFERYIEPFSGSASLFFAAAPRKSVLSDVNPDLINFYKQLKVRADEMCERLYAIPATNESYLEVRQKFSIESCAFDRAVYFWYLNRHCFNGLYRTNNDGIFNVPFGKKLPVLPSPVHVADCVRQLRKARLICSDYKKIVRAATEGDFVYIDPPYKRGLSKRSGEYGLGAMQDSEMDELLALVRDAADRGVFVLFSYNDDLSGGLPGWEWEVLQGRHLISADPKCRKVIQEFTFKNY